MADASPEFNDDRFSVEKGLAGQVARAIEPAIEALGYRLVRVVVSGRDGGTIQVMIDHAERDAHIEDCVAVTREVDPLLDAYMGGLRMSHRLEVSTPGIDRALVRPSDVLAWLGHDVKLELNFAIDNRKRFRGALDDFADGEVRIATDLGDGNGEQVLGFEVAAIDTLKLILTDELLAESQARRAAALAEAGDPAAEAMLDEAVRFADAVDGGDHEAMAGDTDGEPGAPTALKSTGDASR